MNSRSAQQTWRNKTEKTGQTTRTKHHRNNKQQQPINQPTNQPHPAKQLARSNQHPLLYTPRHALLPLPPRRWPCTDLSEFAVPSDKKSYADQAATSYEKASVLASSQLAPTHPVRLGLALNYSVFKYEAQEHHTEACAIAKQAFNDALDGLDQVDDETYKDAALIMQLLKDNLGLWQEPES